MKSNEVKKFEELFGIELTERELMIFNYLSKTKNETTKFIKTEKYTLRYTSKGNFVKRINFLAENYGVEAKYIYEDTYNSIKVFVTAQGSEEKVCTFFKKLTEL